MLFINADREYFEGRAQNYLLPEHIEKIVTAFEPSPTSPASRAIVDNATLRENDYNLNIRRYADNAPPPEPHDVRAHLLGGVPKAEVAAKAGLFSRPRPRPAWTCSSSATRNYFDFRPELDDAPDPQAGHRSQCRPAWPRKQRCATPSTAGGQRTARASPPWLGRWTTASLVGLRNDLLHSFSQRWRQSACSSPFRCAASWPVSGTRAKYDFLTLMARGAKGVVDAWRTSILTALEDEASKDSPLDHKLVKFLMSDFVIELAELEAKKAELESQSKAVAPAKGEDGEETEDESEATEGDEENAVDENQLKAWKTELTKVKKQLKTQKDSFTIHLNKAVDGLTPEAAAELLLTILHNDMQAIVERYIAAQRKQIVAAFETWWSKYRVTLTEIEHKRDEAAQALQEFLKGLGYV